MQRQLSINLGNILLSLSEITDMANPTIAQHQQRTSYIALEIAKCANANIELSENIFSAALLHDIGALSVEEKMLVHNFETTNYELHCIRGEILLEQIPWFQKVAKIIRHHHTRWSLWDASIDDPDVLASQVIQLADYVERLIDRDKYILHQSDDIIAAVKKLCSNTIHEDVVNYFLEASRREEFWLDIASPRLYPLLLRHGPYRNIEIDLDGVALITEAYKGIIDFKSRYTATHSAGVSACGEILSRLFGLSEIDVRLMKIAGDLHDIGKLIIPNSILEKPGKLTKEEFAVIRSHTYYTYYVINTIDGLQHIAKWAAYHHEKLDGSGYPFRCKADEIDTGSRIMSVADIFTAIVEDRPYRPGMSKDNIYKVLNDQTDSNLLDSRIVDLLFDNYDEVHSYVKNKQASGQAFYESRFG